MQGNNLKNRSVIRKLGLLLRGAALVFCSALFGVAGAEGKSFEKNWKRIIYHSYHFLKSHEALIDSDPFYLCSEGRLDSQCELKATLEAFKNPQIDPSEFRSQHALCRYPLRKKFLFQELKLQDSDFPKVRCQALENWKNLLRSKAVSLVFSSSFLGNPASLFGHTFLRFQKDLLLQENTSPILDPTISFAATNPSSNPLFYAVGGLFGSFKGAYSVAPYYLKIQEYNNSESRDLWEFELDLSDDEIENLILGLWEVGPHFSDYYFLHRNCSLMPLALIEAAVPRSELTSRVPLWLIPSDSIRVLYKEPSLVRKHQYRPSNLSRFQARFDQLNPQEKEELKDIFSKPVQEVEPKMAMNFVASSPQVLDTALDYIDYDEQLAGTKLAHEHRELQAQILKVRSKQSQKPQELKTEEPVERRPSLGHPTSRLSGGALFSSKRNSFFSVLKFRPALHSLEDLSHGYSPDLSIRVLDTEITMDQNRRVELRNLELLEVRSISPLRPLILPLSTLFGLGQEYLDNCTPAQASCHRSRFRFAAGISASPFYSRHIVYALGGGDVGYVNDSSIGWNAGPTLIIGHRWELSPRFQHIASFSILRRYGSTSMTDIKWETALQWNVTQDQAAKIGLQSLNNSLWSGIEAHWYF